MTEHVSPIQSAQPAAAAAAAAEPAATLAHTRGPWDLTRAPTGAIYVRCPQTGVVARLIEDDLLFSGSMQGNAALICAAPSMLHVLKIVARTPGLPQDVLDLVDNAVMLTQNPPGVA